MMNILKTTRYSYTSKPVTVLIPDFCFFVIDDQILNENTPDEDIPLFWYSPWVTYDTDTQINDFNYQYISLLLGYIKGMIFLTASVTKEEVKIMKTTDHTLCIKINGPMTFGILYRSDIMEADTMYNVLTFLYDLWFLSNTMIDDQHNNHDNQKYRNMMKNNIKLLLVPIINDVNKYGPDIISKYTKPLDLGINRFFIRGNQILTNLIVRNVGIVNATILYAGRILVTMDNFSNGFVNLPCMPTVITYSRLLKLIHDKKRIQHYYLTNNNDSICYNYNCITVPIYNLWEDGKGININRLKDNLLHLITFDSLMLILVLTGDQVLRTLVIDIEKLVNLEGGLDNCIL